MFFSLTDKTIELLTNSQIIPKSMIQKICTTIWITYDSLRKLSLFSEEASNYFIVLQFLSKSPSINIRQECRQNTNILINIHHLKVCVIILNIIVLYCHIFYIIE